MTGEPEQRLEVQLRVRSDLAAPIARGHAHGAAHERCCTACGSRRQAHGRKDEDVIAHTDAAVGAPVAKKCGSGSGHHVPPVDDAPGVANAAGGKPATPTSRTSTRPASGSRS